MLGRMVTGDLRRAREAWLVRALESLRSHPDVKAAFLWGSLAGGTSDDWSDVDFIVFVDDAVIGELMAELRRRESPLCTAVLVAEMPQNGVEGGGYLSATYVQDDWPLHVDWYLCPAADAAHFSDAVLVVGSAEMPTAPTSFSGLLQARRSTQRITCPAEDFVLWMIPIVAKYVVRRSPQTDRLLTLVGLPAGLSATHAIAELRRLLSQAASSDQEATTAIRRLLDLADASLAAVLPRSDRRP